jgi:hypothetical protein
MAHALAKIEVWSSPQTMGAPGANVVGVGGVFGLLHKRAVLE